MNEPTEVGFFIQIRERGADHDSERDWLHDISPTVLEYETWDAAHADLDKQMQDYLTEYEEDREEYTIDKTYNINEGGGFWWKTPSGREGRTSIRAIVKV